jgi:hypothetical protein
MMYLLCFVGGFVACVALIKWDERQDDDPDNWR